MLETPFEEVRGGEVLGIGEQDQPSRFICRLFHCQLTDFAICHAFAALELSLSVCRIEVRGCDLRLKVDHLGNSLETSFELPGRLKRGSLLGGPGWGLQSCICHLEVGKRVGGFRRSTLRLSGPKGTGSTYGMLWSGEPRRRWNPWWHVERKTSGSSQFGEKANLWWLQREVVKACERRSGKGASGHPRTGHINTRRANSV
jgi:hypothetical protein